VVAIEADRRRTNPCALAMSMTSAIHSKQHPFSRRASRILFTTNEVAVYYAVRVPKLKPTRVGERRGPCPLHDGKHDNFAVDPETGLWFCHSVCACGGDIVALEQALTRADFKAAKAEVFRLVGRNEPEYWHGSRRNGNSGGRARTKPNGHSSAWREVERYQYLDGAGNLRFEVVRQERGQGVQRKKKFLQRRPDGKGGWIWNLDGVDPLLYQLPKLLKRSTEATYLCEGEKCVQTLEAWGLLATCNPMGAGNWRSEYSAVLRGRVVVILPDNDEPGQKHAAAVATALLGVVASVRMVELPGLPEKGDVTDWRDAGGTIERFRAQTAATVPLDEAALSELRARWNLTDEAPHDHQAHAEAANDWPKPEPVQSELPPVETFSVDLLPASFRPLALDVKERMQVPMDYPAVVIVLCLAGVVNRRAIIQPKAHDTEWLVVPNLWGGLIAPPGFMKSPVIQAVTRPLNQIQAEWRQEYEAALNNHARAKEEFELRRAAWREQYKASAKSGKATPARPDDAPEEPKLQRLVVNDATFEALHQTMSENPAGILVIRDELTGWLSQLDRSGREGERAFCLQAWNGDTGHTIDRIGRGTIHVGACCMSLLGGIQPGRLRSYMVDALQDGPSNDGLIQRFQLLVWPDTAPDWAYVDRAPEVASQEKASRVFRTLVELNAENPVRFHFAHEAQELFIEWLGELEAKIRGDELHPALISHLSKYRKLMPALALLFELGDRASCVGFEGSVLVNSDNLVSLEHTKQAAAFCQYLESHARRVYSCIVTPQLRAARELAEKIRKRKIGADGFFTCRDVYLKGWSGLDTPEAVKLAAAVLQDAGWVRELSGESGPFGGRPSNRYEVNPVVWK
jgi:Protein of unknown function (DUF3987)